MLRTRVIPTLLVQDGGLVKTTKFSRPVYVGDPINAVRIFNEKDVDEILILDIAATSERRPPNFEMIEGLAEECFMPLAYGGGITTLDQIRRILKSGVEKVVLNDAAVNNPEILKAASDEFGSQAIVVSIDATRSMMGGYKAMTKRGKLATGHSPVAAALKAEALGAGEILLNAIDRDGVMGGMDNTLIKQVASQLTVPLIAVGGVGALHHLKEAHTAGASAIAAGAFFLFQGPHRAVLISYPDRKSLIEVLG